MRKIENKDKIRIIKNAIFRIEREMNIGICSALYNAIMDLYKWNKWKIPLVVFSDKFLKDNFKRIEEIASKSDYDYKRKVKPDFYDSRFWWLSSLIDVRVNVLKEYLRELENDNK